MEQFSTRQNKISRLVQREMADILLQLNKSKYQGKLITVTIVRVTKDMGIARIYLSIFPSEYSTEILNCRAGRSPLPSSMLLKRLKVFSMKKPVIFTIIKSAMSSATTTILFLCLNLNLLAAPIFMVMWANCMFTVKHLPLCMPASGSTGADCEKPQAF